MLAQNTIVLRVLLNQNVQLVQNGEVLREFVVTRKPRLAKSFVVALNSLKDASGRAIYENYEYHGHYLWGLHNEELFSHYCSAYAAYKDVLGFLFENNLRDLQYEDPFGSGLEQLVKWLWQSDDASEQRWRQGLLYRALKLVQLVAWVAFLLAAVLKSRLQNVRTAIYSYDDADKSRSFDRRLKDLYAFLFRTKTPFIEVFPTFSFAALRNFRLRRRFAVYYPPYKHVPTSFFRKYDFTHFEMLDRILFERMVNRVEVMIFNDMHAVPFLRKTLRLCGIKRVYGIDDSWFSTPLIVSCALENIPLVGMQHGYYTPYHMGPLQNGIPPKYAIGFPKLLVWGESSRDFLLRNSSSYNQEKIEIAGYIRPLGERPKVKKVPRDKFAVLYAYEILADIKDVAAYINAFLDKGYDVWFKLRWDETIERQMVGLPKDRLKLIHDLKEVDLGAVDVCAGSSTSFLQEAYWLGLPIWYLDGNVDFLESLVGEGMASKITLEMLRSPDFDPHAHLIPPDHPEKFYAPKNFEHSLTMS